MSGPTSRTARPPLGDRPVALAVAFGFALSLGIGTVAIPLVALDAGYDAAAIGFLAAVAAASQLTTRLGLPWLLGRYPDRELIGLAGGLGAPALVSAALAVISLPVAVASLAGVAASPGLVLRGRVRTPERAPP